MKVQAIGSVYTIWLNGKQVSVFEAEKVVDEGPLGLQLHGGKVMAADVVTLDEAGTFQGETVAFTVEGGDVMVNESQVIVPDVEGSNGVIHVIDAVLIPQGE